MKFPKGTWVGGDIVQEKIAMQFDVNSNSDIYVAALISHHNLWIMPQLVT